MARIRSIKPTFWTDGKNMRLSDSTSLFFIGLWNFCDDEGKHQLDYSQLVAEFGGRWHRGKIKLFIKKLLESGQIRIGSEHQLDINSASTLHQLDINSASTWIQVVGWSNQFISRPIQPKVKTESIHWVTNEHTCLNPEDYGSKHRKDRIGKDRINPPTPQGELAGVSELVFENEEPGTETPIGKPALTKEDINGALNAWSDTLSELGCGRDLTQYDEIQIATLLNRFDLRFVIGVIVGAKYEKPTQSFDPKTCISLSRIFKPGIRDKLFNLAHSASVA